ncbi:bacterio-opsin activator domain-containing protein [Halomarina ordinaria]|uniref:Bacterio-opsin activator domain-containing protein n=1 Tax=Halomarina ordinaria TaxID=3033939 RepID=A0ABD5UEX5_9EURY|nr:bacterio-opsin activator domain-containing protein [Halomarina sp. PSRA2]
MLADEGCTTGAGVLDAADYERLRRAAETHREDVVLRLCAEVGLLPAEVTRVRLVDVTSHGRHFLLRVREGEGATREAYLPRDVEHALRKYAESAGVAPDDPLVDVSPRRVQMLVAEVAAGAADATGRAAFESVSSRDLRQYFVRDLLVRRRLDPRVVLAVGPYDRPEQLAAHLDPADREAVVAAFERRDGETPRRSAGGEARLRTVATLLREASDALGDPTTADGVRRVACDRVAGTSAYRGAAVVDPASTEGPTAVSGPVGPTVAALSSDERARASVEAAVEERAVRTTAVDGRTSTTDVTVVALPHDETVYGALCLVPTRPVGGVERDLLATYGSRVAAALAGVEHRRLLLADTVTELTLETDDETFLGTTAAALDCSFRLEGLAPVGGGALLHYVTLRGASPDAALERAAGAPDVEDARLVSDRADGASLELVLTDSPAQALVARGGTVRDLTASGGTVRLVGEVASDATVREVVGGVREAYPRTRLVAKHERERSARDAEPFAAGLDGGLTDRQASVLRAAYYAGYFEWPRESTAEELADSVGVSSPTLHNHLRRAQQKLLTAYLDEGED